MVPAQTSEQTAPQEIGVDEAAALWEGGTFLLDVREPEEWDQVHISGAGILLEAGFDPGEMASMAGGVTEWETKGYPVVR